VTRITCRDECRLLAALQTEASGSPLRTFGSILGVPLQSDTDHLVRFLSTLFSILLLVSLLLDRLCGLVVRVLGYRSGSPGSIPGTTKKKK
jgi:hypothetical protein